MQRAVKLGPPWNIRPTAFNQAVADGRLLQARALMAQGQGPDDTSWDLGRLIDTPGALLLLNELKPQQAFLPGSTQPLAVQLANAREQAERLNLCLPSVRQATGSKDKRARL
jgi:hypothetical protein